MPCARFVVPGPSDRGLRCEVASWYLLLLSRAPAAPTVLARGGGGERRSNRVSPSAVHAQVVDWKGIVSEAGVSDGVAGVAEDDAVWNRERVGSDVS